SARKPGDRPVVWHGVAVGDGGRDLPISIRRPPIILATSINGMRASMPVRGFPMSALLRGRNAVVFTALMLLMAATRFHHLGSALHLPDASLAVFFIGGALLP